jgi:hypothetical protein
LGCNRRTNVATLCVNDEWDLRWNLPPNALGQAHSLTAERLKIGKIHLECGRMWGGRSNERVDPPFHACVRIAERERE